MHSLHRALILFTQVIKALMAVVDVEFHPNSNFITSANKSEPSGKPPQLISNCVFLSEHYVWNLFK